MQCCRLRAYPRNREFRIMDRFTVMKSFVAVVKAGSFTAAARSLGISRGLVSRHIADLEEQLGNRLVNRTTRSVSLTEAGHRYFDFSKRVLAEIDEQDTAIVGMREKPEGTLAVVCPKWIGSLDLGNAIASFAVAYPKIKVKLDLGGVSERTYDFIEGGYDVAFHTKYLLDSSVKVKKIAILQFILCASPDYIARRQEPQDLKDLARHDCLVHTKDAVWHFTKGARGEHYKPQNVAFSSNTYLVLRKAAIRGMGIALLPLCSIYNEVRSGSLQSLLPGYQVPDRPLYAAYSPGHHTARKVRCFIDFMADWFKKYPILSSDPS